MDPRSETSLTGLGMLVVAIVTTLAVRAMSERVALLVVMIVGTRSTTCRRKISTFKRGKINEL